MNKLFKFALAALPMLMLASCAKDDLESEAPKAEKSETRYLKVTLTSPTASPVSRAWPEDDTQGDGTTENPGTHVVGGNGYYADGTEQENKIQTLDFYFYTRDKQYHSHVPVTVTDADGNATGPQTPTENPRDGESPNIAAFYHCNVPIELEQGQEIPAYVVCIVNAVEATKYQEKSMTEAQLVELGDIYSSGSGSTKDERYFGMSNSVFYGRDDVTGNSGELVMATPFTTDKLLTKTTLETLEDQAANPDAPNRNEIEKYTINIPVERYAVKVNIDLSPLAAGNISDYPAVQSNTSTLAEGEQPANSPTIKLKFTPKRWGVNGIEKSFYFIKCFRDYKEGTFTPTNTFATQAQLDEILFTGWNSPEHKRCFWSRTPTYYSNQYPITSDDISEPEKGVTYNLQYKSWEDCAVINDPADKLGKYTEYAMETTMMKNRLNGVGLGDNYLPTASLPAVILLGQYTVGDMDKPVDFYLYGKSGSMPIIYSGEIADEQIPGTTKILDRMLFDQNIILMLKDGKYTPVNKFEDIKDFYGEDVNPRTKFEIEHPEKAVRDYAINALAASNGSETSTLHISEEIQVLQISADINAGVTEDSKKLYFYNPKYTYQNGTDAAGKPIMITGGYQAISSENFIQVNHLLYQNLGGASFYQKGMAFFTAPIQHWGWYRSGNPNYGLTWDKWNWQEMKTGDFGIVRNHEYTMKIASITGLGTGIPDPNSPIVPPSDKVDYAVHFHVNIQRWAVLPEQEWNW